MLKVGIIGLSEGNGHPYSWSSIINGGFDQTMWDCGYAAIPRYLTANKDTLGIEGAKVTHIWTQDKRLSQKVAQASLINNVVDDFCDLIGKVDAVILARDDAENHKKMAEPFIEAGIPLFIDKPLAANWQDLIYFKEQVDKGKFIMSCSSMRYASENRAVKQNIDSFGKIELVTAIGKKDWLKYGVHMLEVLISFLDDPKAVAVKHISQKSHQDIVYIEFETGLLAVVNLFYEITPTFQMSIFGQNSWKLIEYSNWYAMFRDNLVEFIRSVREAKPRLAFSKTENIVKILIVAQDSLKQGGKTIHL